MRTTGRLTGKAKDIQTGKLLMTFLVDAQNVEDLEGELDLIFEKHREHRSKNANALLWECIGKIASALETDKWDIYLKMLKRYGQFTYIIAKKTAVEAVKKQWRESEELGEIDIHGEAAVQMLCYYGSSTYDTKQFHELLEGVKSEMKEIGIPTPDDEQIERAIAYWQALKEGGA